MLQVERARVQNSARSAGGSGKGVWRQSVRGDLASAAGAGKDQPRVAQPFDSLGVGLSAGALPEHSAVPLESEGLEGAQDSGVGTWDLPWAIEVLHAYQPLAAGRPRVEIAAEGGDQGAEMQGSRRGRGEATAIHRRLIRRLIHRRVLFSGGVAWGTGRVALRRTKAR